MLRAAPTTVVPILKVVEADNPQARDAIELLIARGWLVMSEPVMHLTEEQCVLCGKGLEMARQIADQPRPAGSTNVAASSGATCISLRET